MAQPPVLQSVPAAAGAVAGRLVADGSVVVVVAAVPAPAGVVVPAPVAVTPV